MSKFLTAAASGLLLVSTSVLGINQAWAKDVSLTVDGQTHMVRSSGATVADILSGSGVNVTERDSVAPSLQTMVNGVATIKVVYARPFTLVLDGSSTTTWTTALNVGDALAAAGLDANRLALSLPTSTGIGRDGLTVTATTLLTVTVNHGSSSYSVQTTAGKTVAEVLQLVHLESSSLVADPALSSPVSDGMTITVSFSTLKVVSTAKSSTSSTGGKVSSSSLTPAVGNTCKASNYDEPQMTASGEVFDPSAMTAAHKTLPMGTRVKVTNPANGKTVVVRINDRGPYIAGRCLDLSAAAFARIASLSQGVITVVYEVL